MRAAVLQVCVGGRRSSKVSLRVSDFVPYATLGLRALCSSLPSCGGRLGYPQFRDRIAEPQRGRVTQLGRSRACIQPLVRLIPECPTFHGLGVVCRVGIGGRAFSLVLKWRSVKLCFKNKLYTFY